jgi:exodeoxyribonuclease VII small subunit
MSTKKPVKKGEKLNFEAVYTELESLISRLEHSESMSLEASLEAFESAIKLTREAQAALSEAEQKVQLLIEQNGQPVATEMSGDEVER